MQSGIEGVVPEGIQNVKFVVNGRSASPAGSNAWTVYDHGFTLITGVETRVPRAVFHAEPSGGGRSSSHGSMQTYYEEIAAAARRVAPAAEHVRVVYHVVRRAGGGEAASTVQPKNPDSQAHRVVCGMLRNFKFTEFLPEAYKSRAAHQLHSEGPSGVEQFLTESVEQQAMPLAKNQYALMPDASPELKEEVLELLRNDADYDFVAAAQRALPLDGEGLPPKHDVEPKAMPGCGDAAGSGASKKLELQPAALGIHTDVSAQECLKQFKGSFGGKHPLGRVAPGRKRHVLFLKFWRSIDTEQPVQNHHLAMLDKSSLDDSEIHEIEVHFNGLNLGQYRLDGTNCEKHRWVYFPRMKHDEVICFMQGDMTMHAGVISESGDESMPSVTFPRWRQDHATFHTAFVDPTAPADAPPRESVEAGVFVFFPEEPDVPQSTL